MFDQSFVRAWRLYLAGSLAAFRTGCLQFFQIVFARHASKRNPLDAETVKMESFDAIIIGGGPAGSTCAQRLLGGMDVLIVNKADFPRGKLCSGWITLGVLDDLKLEIDDYRRGRVFQPMSGFAIGIVGGGGGSRAAGSRSITAGRSATASSAASSTTTSSAAAGAAGAGRGGQVDRPNRRQMDRQRPLPGANARGRRRTFLPRRPAHGQGDRARPGDCGPGIGDRAYPGRRGCLPCRPALAGALLLPRPAGLRLVLSQGQPPQRRPGHVVPQQLPQQVQDFYLWLKRQGRLPNDLPTSFPGHAYLTYEQAARRLVGEGVVWIGDAAGLAHNESGEGIHPAIQSGLMAADAIIAAQGDYRVEKLDAYRRRMEAQFGPRQQGVPPPRATSAFRRRVAHWLLGRRWFVRRVVLDRWFLRRS